MGGGKKNKYANRSKNKKEKKEREKSEGNQSLQSDLDSSSKIDDVEMKSEDVSKVSEGDVTTSEFTMSQDDSKGNWDDFNEDIHEKDLKDIEKSMESEVKPFDISEEIENNIGDDFKRPMRSYPRKNRWDNKESSFNYNDDKQERNRRSDREFYTPRSKHENVNKKSEVRTPQTPESIEKRKNLSQNDSTDSNWDDSRKSGYRSSGGNQNFWRSERGSKSFRDGDESPGFKNDENKQRRSHNRDSYNSSFGSNRNSSQSRDREYDRWGREFKDKVIKDEDTNVIETFGDLFCVSDDYALGHCVAEDMNMGSGIATQFRSKFKRVEELLDQRIKQGGVAILKDDKRFIYYLVTKRYSNGKPTYETLFRSLREMRKHVEDHNVKKIALPRIGCGLDGLEWTSVKSMLQFIFKDVDVEIKIYNFQQDPQDSFTKPSPRKCPVKNVLKPVVDIEEYTTIIYICSKNYHVSKIMSDLDKKFNIVEDYKRATRNLGSIIRTECKSKYYLIYGVVVKENPEDNLSYGAFQKCISEINKLNKKDQYEYIAIEGFSDRKDNLIINKLINLMRNTFYQVEVYVCWPDKLKHLAPRELQYS